jgi:hypothetical protein
MPSPRTPTPELLQCKVRLRPDLRRKIDHAARERGVTKTEEMVHRIERSFDRDPLAVLITDLKRLISLQGGAR